MTVLLIRLLPLLRVRVISSQVKELKSIASERVTSREETGILRGSICKSRISVTVGGVLSAFPVAVLIQVSLSKPVPSLPSKSLIPLALTVN